MTERIKEIKEYQWEKRHHKARQPLPETLCYRDPGLSDTLRSALRTKQALDAEQPFLFPGEYIAFTRTLPNLPFLYDEGEWADITSTHFIHESGNVSNLSPD